MGVSFIVVSMFERYNKYSLMKLFLLIQRLNNKRFREEDKKMISTLDEQISEKNKDDNKQLYEKISEIMIRLQSGDKGAFQDLYENTSRYIYSCIIQNGITGDNVEEVMQETYLSIYNSYMTLKNPLSGMAWMKKIAYYKSIDFIRVHQKENLAYTAEQLEYFEELPDDQIVLPEDFVSNVETQKIVRSMIEALPSDQKSVLYAFYYNDCKISEISKIMDMPEGTVKTKLYRAKASLKTKVEDYSKKSGTKLYSVTMLPLLLFLYGIEAGEVSVPASYATNLFGKLGIQQVKYSGTAAKVISTTHATKSIFTLKNIICTIAMVSAIGVGTGVAVNYFTKKPEEPVAQESNQTMNLQTKEEATTQQETKAAKNEWKYLYKDLLINRSVTVVGKEGYYKNYINKQSYMGAPEGEYIFIKDFDHDGVPELILSNFSKDACFLFQIKNGKCTQIDECTCMRSVIFPTDTGFGIESSGGASDTQIKLYTINSNGLLSVNETLESPNQKINEIMKNWSPINVEQSGTDLSTFDIEHQELQVNE